MATVFCSNCGQQIDDQQRFCPNCGAPTQPSGQAPVYFAQPQPVMYAIKPKIPGRGFGITSMVLGIIGLVYSVIAFVEALVLINADYRYVEDAAGSVVGVSVVYSILSILALIFGCCARGRQYKNGISASGITMGSIGITLYLLSIIIASSV